MYLFTAFVCEKVTTFYGLGVLLCGAASISLIGLYSFVSADRADSYSDKENVREVKKWLKDISHL